MKNNSRTRISRNLRSFGKDILKMKGIRTIFKQICLGAISGKSYPFLRDCWIAFKISLKRLGFVQNGRQNRHEFGQNLTSKISLKRLRLVDLKIIIVAPQISEY